MGGMGEGILSDRLRAAPTLHVRVVRTPGADFAAEVTDDDGTRLALAAMVHPVADWRGAGHAVELVCADTGRPMITVLDRADLGLGAGEVLDDGALPLGVVRPWDTGFHAAARVEAADGAEFELQDDWNSAVVRIMHHGCVVGLLAPAAAVPWRSRLPGGPAPEPVTLRWERLDRDGRAGQGDGADPGAGPWGPAGDAALLGAVVLEAMEWERRSTAVGRDGRRLRRRRRSRRTPEFLQHVGPRVALRAGYVAARELVALPGRLMP